MSRRARGHPFETVRAPRIATNHLSEEHAADEVEGKDDLRRHHADGAPGHEAIHRQQMPERVVVIRIGQAARETNRAQNVHREECAVEEQERQEKELAALNVRFSQTSQEYESIKAEMETDFPYSGQITMKISGAEKIAFRKPYWCKNLKITLNGGICDYSIEKGYIYINLQKGQNNLIFELDMTVRLVHSKPRIYENYNRTA